VYTEHALHSGVQGINRQKDRQTEREVIIMIIKLVYAPEENDNTPLVHYIQEVVYEVESYTVKRMQYFMHENWFKHMWEESPKYDPDPEAEDNPFMEGITIPEGLEYVSPLIPKGCKEVGLLSIASDGMFGKERRTILLRSCTAYVMNDKGATIDKLCFSE
jgi:hypothetical protein